MKGNVLHTCRAPTDVAPEARGWLMPSSCLILPMDLCRPALGPLGGKAALAFAGLLHRLTWIWFEPAHPRSSGSLSFFRLPSVHSGPGHHTHHPEGRRHPLVTAEVMACCQGQASHPPWSLPSAKQFQGTSTASSLLILPYPWGVGSTAARRER